MLPLQFLLPRSIVEAFTITRYQLEVQVDRTSHVMVVTGKLTLRNDSKTPQKVAALQVSSSLEWNSITLDDKPVQWLSDEYTTDIDHTGALPRRSSLCRRSWRTGLRSPSDVQYGGTITPDCEAIDPHGRSRRRCRSQRLGPDQR